MSSTTRTTLLLESSLVFALRAALFFAARKYLLRSLYHDLQGLYSEAEPTSLVDTDSVELEVLPGPSPTSAKHHTSISLKRTFHSVVSRTLFSLSFSESCTLFLLLMCQGLDILHPRTRLLNWNLSLFVLLTSIVVLIPLSYSLILSYRSSSVSQTLQRPTLLRLIITTLPVGFFVYLLSFVPLPSAVASSSTSANILTRLTVLGTLILGLLSGFGAVSNAWTFFPRLSRGQRRYATDDEVLAVEDGLKRVRDDLAQRRKDIARIETAQPNADSSWVTRMMPNIRGNTQLSETMQELNGLVALEYQMSRNLDSLKREQKEAKFSKSISGKLFNWGGRLFALYCVYRILISVFNLLAPIRSHSPPSPDGPDTTSPPSSSSSIDFLTMILAYLLSLLSNVKLDREDIALISRQISLGLVGVIILSSIRTVLRGVARALRVTSRNLGTSLMLLILAQLMGIYLLSTLIQLRTSFPPPPSRPDITPDDGTVNLFSTLPEFQVFGSLFDGSFLLAAGVSAAVLWFDERINGSGVASRT